MKSYIGYHGSTVKNIDTIMNDDFQIRKNKIGWLGTGFYLFEENPQMAQYWSQYKYPNQTKALVRCEIEVPTEKTFDVVDPLGDDNKYFHAIRKRLIESEFEKRGTNVRVKNQTDFDGKTYNMICNAKGIKLVRAATYTYQELDRQYRLQSRVPNGIELCIRDPEIITNKERISEVERDEER